jgi:hypothetical protein
VKINYGLWWNEGKKRVSRNFSIEYDMDWDNQEDHNKFRSHILEKHPGTHIIGYAIREEDEHGNGILQRTVDD